MINGEREDAAKLRQGLKVHKTTDKRTLQENSAQTGKRKGGKLGRILCEMKREDRSNKRHREEREKGRHIEDRNSKGTHTMDFCLHFLSKREIKE